MSDADPCTPTGKCGGYAAECRCNRGTEGCPKLHPDPRTAPPAPGGKGEQPNQGRDVGAASSSVQCKGEGGGFDPRDRIYIVPDVTYQSAAPHNALEDARAIRRALREAPNAQSRTAQAGIPAQGLSPSSAPASLPAQSDQPEVRPAAPAPVDGTLRCAGCGAVNWIADAAPVDDAVVLREALQRCRAIATGEHQVPDALDDTDGLREIVKVADAALKSNGSRT